MLHATMRSTGDEFAIGWSPVTAKTTHVEHRPIRGAIVRILPLSRTESVVTRESFKSASPIHLFMVDDYNLVREGLLASLVVFDDFRIIGEIEEVDGVDATVDRIVAVSPDIAVFGFRGDAESVFRVASKVRGVAASTRIVLLAPAWRDALVARALEIRPNGLLSKSDHLETIVTALRSIASGEDYFTEEVRDRIRMTRTGARFDGAATFSSLTARKMEVLLHIAEGRTKKQIAATMNLSPHTVSGHTERLMTKLAVHDRVALTRLAIREGLITP